MRRGGFTIPARAPLSLVLVLFTLVAPRIALAQASITGTLGGSPDFFVDSDPVFVTDSLGAPGALGPQETAFAVASIPNGIVRAEATGYFSIQSGARASITDVITITGPPSGDPVTATVSWDISGSSISLNNIPAQTVLGESVTGLRARVSLRAVFGTNLSGGATVDLTHIAQRFFTLDADGNVVETSGFTFDDSVNRPDEILRGSFRVPNPVQPPVITTPGPVLVGGFGSTIEMDVLVRAGERFQVFTQVEPSAGGFPGARASMRNGGLVTITLPDGYGFDSDSGVLLTEPPELLTVPLSPVVATMLALGLLGTGLAVMRRSEG